MSSMNQRKYQEAGVEEREKHAMIERQHGSLAELQRKILKNSHVFHREWKDGMPHTD